LPTPGLRIDDAYRRIRDAVSAETNGEQVPDAVRDDWPDCTIPLVKPASGGAPPSDGPQNDAGGRDAVMNLHLVDRRIQLKTSPPGPSAAIFGGGLTAIAAGD
jgi:hypothetical protein